MEQKRNLTETYKTYIVLSMVIVWGITLCGLWGLTQSTTDHQMLYALVISAAGILVEVFAFNLIKLLGRNTCLPDIHSGKVSMALTMVGALFIMLAGINRIRTEALTMDSHAGRSTLLWNVAPAYLVLPVSIIVIAYAVFCFKNELKQAAEWSDPKLRDATTYLCYAFVIVIYAYSLYSPNILNNDRHHMTAATQSIYNTAFETPFNIRTTGIYGHYAIFFWPFLKIFGHKPQAVACMIAGAGALCEFLVIYSIHHSLHSNTLRKMAALATALPIVVIYQNSYFQAYPLRIMPAALMMAYTVWVREHEKGKLKLKLAAGFVLAAAAVTWVTDAGMVAALAYAAWIIRRYGLQEGKINARQWLGLLLGCIVGCMAALLGMVLIVNGYNVIICRSEPVLRACFFPFVGTGNFAEGLQMKLQWKNYSWIWVIFLFFVSTIVGLVHTKLVALDSAQQNEQKKLDLLFMFALMGVGQAAYYFNRAAYHNLTVAMPEAAVCMAILVELTFWHEKKRNFKTGFGTIMQRAAAAAILVELSALAAALVVCSGDSVRTRMRNNYTDMSSLRQVAQEVERRIPKNTYAVGYGTQEIYAELGWNPGYLQRDVSDFFGDGVEDIREEINMQQSLLLTADMVSKLDDPDDWSQADAIVTDQITLLFFIHK